jgi:inner membrane protein
MVAARAYRRKQPTRFTLFGSMVIWSALSLLPDADVLGFRYGIKYADPWGHRGATHSFAFSVALGLAIGLLASVFRLGGLRTGLVATLVIASHAALDTLTDGGLGCALFWPFDDQRYFAPWNPIPVAPIGRHFFSSAGLSVALTELALFAPLFLYALWPRRRRT